MRIETNGIMIERLQEKDIELVRQWRNTEEVRKHMNYREQITPDMQKKWFRSVNNFNNFYFLIHYKNRKVGLGNIKNVNWQERSAEAGIFIVDNNISGSYLPVVGVLSLSSLVFDIFDLKKLYGQIRKENTRAKKFSRIFGYKMVPGEEDKESQLHILTKENFIKASKKLFMLMKPMGFANNKLTFIMEQVDFQTEFANRIIKLLDNSPLLFDIEKRGDEVVYTQS